MTEMIKLYRADYKGNITLPEKYRTEGLLTKQMDGGNPFFYEKYGWINSIKSHISCTNNIEKFLYETTAFLSATENENIAKNIYLPTKNNYRCEITTMDFADAYIFMFQIEREKIKQYCKGIYTYDFQCNYAKFKDPQSIVDLFIKCNICSNNKDYWHTILLIDAATYLNELVLTNKKLQSAYESSQKDHEWLLMPLDPMTDGKGYQSRIPISNFWSVEHYKYLNKLIH
jgi:hypothetical protein